MWFCQYEDKLFFVLSEHDQEPDTYPVEAASVKRALELVRDNNFEIEQVGILPPEMLGLE